MTLIQSSSPGRHTTSRSVGRNYQSLFVMLIVSVFLLGGIGSRLAYLQIIQGEQNRQLAENNRIRLIPKPPVRGNIFDRKGKILASSRLSHSVFLWPIALKPDEWRKSLDIKPETVQVLRQGLRQVVSGGTGKAMDVPTLPPTSGKSGTAEAPPGLSHAWFGAYAPADKPEIVVVAFAEHSGGGGGKVAAPMVRQVMESYFKPKKPAEATKAKQKTP
jgi:cell division protein FtsI/penicillin-binding protein 2